MPATDLKRMPKRLPKRLPKRRRGATLYVAVMGVGMIVGVIALTTSLIGRLALRSNQTHVDSLEAAAAAHSGVEFALNWINRTTDWRDQLTNGVDSDLFRTRNGSFRYRVTDVDGDLADDARDHAILRVVGYQDDARYAVEVDIEPAGRALTCLEAAAHAAINFTVGSAAQVNGSGIASAGNNFAGTGASINLDVEVSNSATGGQYNADWTEGVAVREVPGEHVFDWYVEHGTQIAYSDLTVSFGVSRIQSARFSRLFNEYGDPNPKGIYWIDCAGESPRIRWSRLFGTLVLLNAGSSTRVEDVTVFQAEAKNYPLLMVQGDLQLDLRSMSSGQELLEGVNIFGTVVGTNLNPPGVPYEGVEDDDLDDVYAARLDGIVYATGTVTISDEVDIQGNLIANQITVNDNQTLKVDYTPYANNYPPPGFSTGQGARVLPGSYRRVSLDNE